MSDIEARNFTYCQAFYTNPWNCRGFLVMTPARAEATKRAAAFAAGHAEAWGEPTKILLYPRNYVKKARELYAAGLHDLGASRSAAAKRKKRLRSSIVP